MSRGSLVAVALLAAPPLAHAETNGAPDPQPVPTEEPIIGGGIYVRTDKIAAWIEATAGTQIAEDTCVGSGRALLARRRRRGTKAQD